MPTCFTGVALLLISGAIVSGDDTATTPFVPPMFEPDYPLAVVYPSANFDERNNTISVLILHYTATATAQEALDILTQCKVGGVSAHYLVYENGTIFQLVKESKRARHSGLGGWREIDNDMNSASIGIEIQNPGDLYPNNYEPPFASAQILAVIDLAKSIVSRYNIIPGRVIGHQDHAPTRKPDPGHSFPWKQLFDAGLGVWAEPALIVNGTALTLGDNNTAVLDLQTQLRTLGYIINQTGTFDDLTKACVVAFQKHWRQTLFDGVADNSTIETLRRVVTTAQVLDNPTTPIPQTTTSQGIQGPWTGLDFQLCLFVISFFGLHLSE